jgi:hypothetical protein
VGEGGERIAQFIQIDQSKTLEACCRRSKGMEPFSIFHIRIAQRIQSFTVLEESTPIPFTLLSRLKRMLSSPCASRRMEVTVLRSHSCFLARQLRNCIKEQRERLDT